LLASGSYLAYRTTAPAPARKPRTSRQEVSSWTPMPANTCGNPSLRRTPFRKASLPPYRRSFFLIDPLPRTLIAGRADRRYGRLHGLRAPGRRCASTCSRDAGPAPIVARPNNPRRPLTKPYVIARIRAGVIHPPWRLAGPAGEDLWHFSHRKATAKYIHFRHIGSRKCHKSESNYATTLGADAVAQLRPLARQMALMRQTAHCVLDARRGGRRCRFGGEASRQKLNAQLTSA
jgi:hypothetical protein